MQRRRDSFLPLPLINKILIWIDQKICTCSKDNSGNTTFYHDTDVVPDLTGSTLLIFFSFILGIEKEAYHQSDDRRKGKFVIGVPAGEGLF